MKSLLIALALFALILPPSLAAAHGGGLDSEGCHNDSSTGTRHCHNSSPTPTTSSGSSSDSGCETACFIGIGVGVALLVGLIVVLVVTSPSSSSASMEPTEPIEASLVPTIDTDLETVSLVWAF